MPLVYPKTSIAHSGRLDLGNCTSASEPALVFQNSCSCRFTNVANICLRSTYVFRDVTVGHVSGILERLTLVKSVNEDVLVNLLLGQGLHGPLNYLGREFVDVIEMI